MKTFLSLIVMATCCTTCFAFSGQGSGTEKNPYLVSNADELFEVRNDLSAYYKQVCDIDVTQWIIENNPTQGWTPIGSEEKPFIGVYDGNNFSLIGLSINRETSSNVGMWGCVKNATVKNLAFVNPSVSGNENVGVVVGKMAMPYSNTISSVSVINGNVKGVSCVGGIVGSALLYYEGYWGDYADPQWDISNSTNTINGCVCNANIYGSSECGGICGAANGEYNQPGYLTKHVFKVEIFDNLFMGKITGENYIGGILGRMRPTEGRHYCNGGTYQGMWSENGNYTTCFQNIAMGSLFGEQEVRGIVGQYNEDKMNSSEEGTEDNVSVINHNVSCLDTIKGSSISRISNCQFESNIACSQTIGIMNNKKYFFEDSNENGNGYGISTLRKQSTYEGLGFDFTKTWKISENVTLPYSIKQAAPPTVVEFSSGSKGKIEGTSDGNGNIYIVIGDVLYQTFAVEGKWNITLGSVSDGQLAHVSFSKMGLQPSVPTKTTAIKPADPKPEILSGDSNGDGAVDAADVVAIVNYILGKPSSSFNEKNADANGDGQILVDDAVGTVNIIINEQ